MTSCLLRKVIYNPITLGDIIQKDLCYTMKVEVNYVYKIGMSSFKYNLNIFHSLL